MAQGFSWITIGGVPVCFEGHLADCGHAATGRSWIYATERAVRRVMTLESGQVLTTEEGVVLALEAPPPVVALEGGQALTTEEGAALVLEGEEQWLTS